MNRFYLIFLTGLYLTTGSVVQAVESSSVPSDNTYEPTDPERILVLYDNPMEEHKVISVLIASGFDVRDEKQLETAIELLKKESAKLGAHAIIILPHGHDESVGPGVEKDHDDKKISGKAIRYKHFYY